MKTLVVLSLACLACACATREHAADTRDYTIHNPGLYASDPPLVDDDGHPLPVVSKRPPSGAGSASP